MADELKVNDAVAIDSTDSSNPLEGVVAHLGPVQFAPGSDWIGIRLTGPSVGRGKNDGTVKGVRYFAAGGDKSGMFVKRANVKKRKLSKLEELRLRRELSERPGSSIAASSSSASAAGGKRVSGLKSPRPPPKSAPSPSKGAAGPSTPKPGKSAVGSRRLDDLRARREALANQRGAGARGPASAKKGRTEEEGKAGEVEEDSKEEVGSGENEKRQDGEGGGNQPGSGSPVNLSSATSGYRAELHRLQSRITALESQLKKKEAECTSLQSSLDFMSKGAEQSTHDAVRMYAMGALALTEAKSPSCRKSLGGGGNEDEKCEGKDDDAEGGSSSDEEDVETEGEEGVVNQAAAAVSSALVERNNELTAQLSDLTSKNTDLRHHLGEAEERLSSVQRRYEQSNERYENEKSARADEQAGWNADRAVLDSQISSLQRELKVMQERVAAKSGAQEHSHLSMAKLRAELASMQRKNEELENDKMELEVTMEELVLDKEGLGQEKEVLEDQLEECKIDLESTQLELEDARAQLEEQRSAEGGVGDGAVSGAGDPNASFSSAGGADSQDVTRSLTLQNTRLRTALIRLREQSELERNDLQRQVKAFQSDASSKEELEEELNTLKSTHATTMSEMQELKDIIDQTSSLEETIETLSDKAWNLEEENANLERTIRELEESAEIAAEMEEVQAEELKMVMRDLEGRDALVRNLEEAIRMQRRREEDFQRYVSEFRTTISTEREKYAALLALTEDSSGERSQLLATSRKALAQAAQLGADAAEARKKSGEAAFQTIAARSAAYMSKRLETLLPSGVVSAELAAVKGEMSLARVADKAAASLAAAEEIFNKVIEKGASRLSEFDVLEEGGKMSLSDSASQQIGVMSHQAEFSRMAIEAGADALRLMAAGQWPDLLSQDVSTDLGSVVVHSVHDLDLALSEQLRLLKSEGVLSPLRSSLTDLDQAVNNTRLALFSATDLSGKTVIPDDWKPPGWEALKSLSLGRFACLGATAVLASAVSQMEDSESEPPPSTPRNFGEVLLKAKQSCASVLDVCKKFSGLRSDDAETLGSLNELAGLYQRSASALFEYVKSTFQGQSISDEDIAKFTLHLDKVLTSARLLAALLRKADLGDHDTSNHHYLSAEFGDSWGGLTEIVKQERSVGGDPEDVNYLMRARAIESQLAEAVQNEPKLVIANAKITSLEKSLASRSKEIHMQNSRIAELERLIQASPATPMSPTKGSMASPTPPAPSVDVEKFKEEARVLQEALDVMQKQTEEYEKEIRSLKDKSRTMRGGVRTAGGRLTPKKSASMDLEATLSQLGQGAPGSKPSGPLSSRDVLLESISLETALFRPVLSSSARSASYWKTQAMGTALSKLSPLNTPTCQSECLSELVLAKNNERLTKASFSVVDLTNNSVSPRDQLNGESQKWEISEQRLQKATSLYLKSKEMDSFAPFRQTNSQSNTEGPLGRITLPCRDGVNFTASYFTTNAELRNVHSFLLQ